MSALIAAVAVLVLIVAVLLWRYRRTVARLTAGQAALRVEKDRFLSIFANVQDVVFQVDRQGRYLAMNPQTRRYGAAPEDLIGKTIHEIMSPADARRHAEAHEHAFRTGQVTVLHSDYPLADGETASFQIALTPVRDAAGVVTSLVGVTRDVTEEVRLARTLRAARDAADAASRAKTFFLANISHELRTPLAVIGGFAEMLAATGDSLTADSARRAVQAILHNSRQLNALVGDLLDLSLLETGRLRIQSERVPLADALAAALADARSKAQAKGLAFNARLAADLPAVAAVDPVHLRQIVANVVGNAVKFTEHGGVDVAAHADGALLTITVTDTGCGVDPAQAAAIFQPFTQADASPTRRFGGTGLGLALARSLARAVGGDVVLALTAAGVGSTFVATVALGDAADHAPATPAATAPRPALAPPPRNTAPRLTGARILVVDDTPDIRAMLEETLTLHGAIVDCAGDGARGLELAAAARYDVILMDIQLPELDGYEVTRRLRAAGTSAPVIALSGRAARGEHAACLAAGCDDYLSKPVALATLVERTARWRAKGHPG